MCGLRCWILFHNLSYLLLIGGAIFLVQVIRLRLSRRLRIRIIQKILDSQQDLLDRDCGLPRLLLVQNRKANCARWIDVGMEKWRDEFACP